MDFGIMKFIGNIIWMVLGGFIISLYYALVGLLFCISIIGIPFGMQHFKMALLALVPFGKKISYRCTSLYHGM